MKVRKLTILGDDKNKSKVESKNFLKIEHRKPHQTTKFLYKALDVAENQIEKQIYEIERLTSENIKMSKIIKNKKNV